MPNQTIPCPLCKKKIRFLRFNAEGASENFMYCEKCPNVLTTKHLTERGRKLFSNPNYLQAPHVLNDEGVKAYKQLFLDLEATLPVCSCNGRFRFSAGVKCPHCKQELPGQYRTDRARVMDPYLIYVESSKLLDADTETWHDYSDQFPGS